MGMDDNKFEHWLTREAKTLPYRKAPASLSPRVLAAIRAEQALPWYRMSWTNWPGLLKLLSLVFFTGLAAVVSYAVGWVWAEGMDLFATHATTETAANLLGPFYEVPAALVSAAWMVVAQINSTVWLLVGITAALFYLSFIGLGSLVYRLSSSHSRH